MARFRRLGIQFNRFRRLCVEDARYKRLWHVFGAWRFRSIASDTRVLRTLVISVYGTFSVPADSN